MTDIITQSVVDRTIVDLEDTLNRATARLATEAADYVAKRDAMVRVAHQRGTANSIGSALDDLLEEFDLARRPWRGTLRMGLRMTAPVVGTSQDHIRLASGHTLYSAGGVSASWTGHAEQNADLREGDTCLCDAAQDVARQWVLAYYGRPHTVDMTIQVGPSRCSHEDCPNIGERWPNEDRARSHDWSNAPSFPAVAPAATPVLAVDLAV